MHLLPTNLGCIADCAAKEDTRYAITGVHVKVNDDNTYRVEATDTHILAVVTGECVDKADLHPFSTYDPVCAAPNGKSESLINAKSFKDFFAKAKKVTQKASGHKPILGSVATVIGEKETTLGATDMEQRPVDRFTNLEGRYPPIRDIIPKSTKKPVCKIRIDAKMLAKLLEVAAQFTDEGIGSNAVDILVFDGDGEKYTTKPLLIKAVKPSKAQHFTGLIQPLYG